MITVNVEGYVLEVYIMFNF